MRASCRRTGMTNRAMGFIGERVGGWKTRTVSTGASQEKQSFSKTNTTFMYRQSHFESVAGLNSTCNWGIPFLGFSKASACVDAGQTALGR